MTPLLNRAHRVIDKVKLDLQKKITKFIVRILWVFDKSDGYIKSFANKMINIGVLL